MIENQKLLKQILEFNVDENDVELSFERRLARENNWTLAFAQRAVLEYKRFIFLVVTSDEPKTPSDEVDQVWHLHLTYTRSYWNRFCRDLLGKEIHHGPTKGGKVEDVRYKEQYAETLAQYQQQFGLPPADIWPSAENRFNSARYFKRVNTRDIWLLQKPRFRLTKWLIVPVSALFLAACSMAEDGVGNKVAIGVAALVALIILSIRLRSRGTEQIDSNKKKSSDSAAMTGGVAPSKSKKHSDSDQDSNSSDGGDGGSSGCGSGCGS